MRELMEEEVLAVSGGAIKRDTGYATSLGAAGVFLGMAIGASALTPFGAGLMAAASILSSSTAIYYSIN